MTVHTIHYQVPDLAEIESFYRMVLGFSVFTDGEALICHLPHGARLVFHQADVARHEANKTSRYWKIGLTMPDLDRAVAHLRKVGWAATQPSQFLDIGYMCHLTDPAGLPIELLQQGFEGQSAAGPDGHDIGAQATLAHVTLRAETRAAADAEWSARAGMKVMSIQPVTPHGFTLYFYAAATAATNDLSPDPDLTAVKNREWLWRRPYTLIEVQVYDDGREITAIDTAMAGLLKIECERQAGSPDQQ